MKTVPVNSLPDALRFLEHYVADLTLKLDVALDRARRDSGQALAAEKGPPPGPAVVLAELTRLGRILGLLRSVEATLYVARDLSESP